MFTPITERMLQAGNLKNHTKLAKVLGITPQALSNYKGRGKLPVDHVVSFAGIYRLSVDWLLTGEGRMHLPEVAEQNPLLAHATNKELLEEVRARIETNGIHI